MVEIQEIRENNRQRTMQRTAKRKKMKYTRPLKESMEVNMMYVPVNFHNDTENPPNIPAF